VDDNRWRSTEHAEAWLDRQNQPPSDLIERFSLIARLLPFDQNAELTFADIGPATARSAKSCWIAFPKARVFSLDVNPKMIEAGEQRLARFGDPLALPPVRFRRVSLARRRARSVRRGRLVAGDPSRLRRAEARDLRLDLRPAAARWAGC